jgi:amino-acid N-acetyltransferase
MPLIKMAAFDVANMVMTQLTGVQVDALIGNWVKARGIGVRDGIDFINAGVVSGVQNRQIDKVISEGHVPILPCIGWSSIGKPYNISSIELAVALAEAVRADKLFFLSDRIEYSAEGLTIPDDGVSVNEDRVSRLTAKSALELLQRNPVLSGTLAGEMLAMAHRAAIGGVARIHVLNGRIDGAILKEIFSTLGQGTMIYTDEFEAIRPMQLKDIPEVLRIMEPNMAKGILVQRSEADLQRQFEDYHVFDTDGTVRGCCALHTYDQEVELAGLVVEEGYGHLGIGAKLVHHAIAYSREKGYTHMFLLTTQTADFFESIGFRRANPSSLPAQKLATIKPERNSRIYILPLLAT